MLISVTYCPFSTEEIAQKVIQTLLDEKIIACGNVVSAQSHFIWKEAQANDREWIVIFKTTVAHKADLMKRLETLHTYDVPCILQWDADANDAYGKWVEEQVF
jgi:periplasmic divalent cation tolerance protein